MQNDRGILNICRKSHFGALNYNGFYFATSSDALLVRSVTRPWMLILLPASCCTCDDTCLYGCAFAVHGLLRFLAPGFEWLLLLFSNGSTLRMVINTVRSLNCPALCLTHHSSMSSCGLIIRCRCVCLVSNLIGFSNLRGYLLTSSVVVCLCVLD